jgi:hypothetical protein
VLQLSQSPPLPVSKSFPLSKSPSKGPFPRIRHHGDKHADDLFVFIVEDGSAAFIEVSAAMREVEPGLRLCGLGFSITEFADESRLVSALSPSLGKVRRHGS